MSDLVNNPAHYKDGGIETIDFIEAKNLNYRLGNVVKYVSRAGKKYDAIQDLEKARWYLDREINRLKEKNNGLTNIHNTDNNRTDTYIFSESEPVLLALGQ